jgi:hypothetical protein
LLTLKRLVNDIYGETEGKADLDWKLRGIDGEGPSDRLDHYLASTPPADAVRSFIFESRSRLEQAFEHLRYGKFQVPGDVADEVALRNRILWKLGADVLYFPGQLKSFWSRLEALRVVARQLLSPYSESDREALRGPGTNFFVSVEEILDLTISFTTWALLNDHWAGIG